MQGLGCKPLFVSVASVPFLPLLDQIVVLLFTLCTVGSISFDVIASGKAGIKLRIILLPEICQLAVVSHALLVTQGFIDALIFSLLIFQIFKLAFLSFICISLLFQAYQLVAIIKPIYLTLIGRVIIIKTELLI